MKRDVFVITGGEPLHIPREQAEHLVSSGAAHWIAKRKIKLNAGEGHGIPGLPEFDELRADNSHWAGVGRFSPRLTEVKQEFLQAMKRLSV